MSEVICPFCGAPNPPEADSCSVCKNSLTETPSQDFNLVEGDQPEWLKELGGFTLGQPGGEFPEPDSGEVQGSNRPDAEVPEWLARVRQRSQEDREESDAELAEQAQTGEESDSSSPFSPNELPSWLFSDDQAADASSSFSEPGGMDWMTVLDGDENHPESSLKPPSSQKPAPDWENFGVEPEAARAEQRGEISTPDLTESAQPSESTAESELPAGAAVLPEAGSDIEQPPAYPDTSGEKAFTADYPDLQRKTEIPTVKEAATGAAVPEPNDLPSEELIASFEDNFSEESAEKLKPPRPSLRDELLRAPEKSREPVPAKEDEIEQAQLPSWLEAMKPIESVAPAAFEAEADQRVENSGPLAGFQGILPGGNLSEIYTKPPVYSFKLKVSDKQRVYASLLENLIADEAKATPEEIVRPTVAGIYLRLVVAVALVGALIFVSLTGFQIGALPNLFAPESVAFFDTAKQLSSSVTPARILVAVEYEPGFSAELQRAGLYPIQQLLSGGANLALVSTLPTGPALGEKLVSDAAVGQSAIDPGQHMIDLGYLPGGSASLASLAAQPSLAAPKTLSGQLAWNSPILQGIHSVADFDGLILLTDSPELARTWIEQVQPALSGKPFLVISSAQSSPMILPYYDSGQIQGLLTGLSGGAVYDQLAQHSGGENSMYWNIYQSGLLVTVIAILAGALFYGARGLFRARPSGKRS